MKLDILSIGDELLIGHTLNTNAFWMAHELNKIGFTIRQQTTISDEKEHILTACQEYKDGIIPLIAVIKILNLYVKRFDDRYLKVQKFLNPYPKELALRSNIKAYK